MKGQSDMKMGSSAVKKCLTNELRINYFQTRVHLQLSIIYHISGWASKSHRYDLICWNWNPIDDKAVCCGCSKQQRVVNTAEPTRQCTGVVQPLTSLYTCQLKFSSPTKTFKPELEGKRSESGLWLTYLWTSKPPPSRPAAALHPPLSSTGGCYRPSSLSSISAIPISGRAPFSNSRRSSNVFFSFFRCWLYLVRGFAGFITLHAFFFFFKFLYCGIFYLIVWTM